MDAEPLLLVPGLLSDTALWQPQCQALAESTRVTVVAPAVGSSMKALASAALEVAPARFALAGHGLGGRIALEIVRKAPRRVTRLALLDCGAARLDAGNAGAMERASLLRLVERARLEGMPAIAASWARSVVHPDRLRDAQLLAELTAMATRIPLPQLVAHVEALLSRPDALNLLRRIMVPTLVLCGLEDWSSPLEHNREMAGALHHSVLVGIPGCGHVSPLERPRAIVDALRAWLSDSPQIHRISI